MTQNLCVVDRCGRPATEMLCSGCTAELVTALRELATGGKDMRGRIRQGLLDDLNDAVTRQTRAGNGSAKRASDEQPLPFGVQASALMWDAKNTVGTWARDLAESNPHLRPDYSTVSQAAAWMGRFPALLAMHPAAQEMHDEIGDLERRVRRMVDRAPDKRYLGLCGAVLEGVKCKDSLFAAIYQESVSCRTCGTEHDAYARWAQVQDRVRGYLATAAEIAELIAPMFGRRINVKTIRTWADRGHILTRGRSAEDEPMHLVGEVLDVAEARVGLRATA